MLPRGSSLKQGSVAFGTICDSHMREEGQGCRTALEVFRYSTGLCLQIFVSPFSYRLYLREFDTIWIDKEAKEGNRRQHLSCKFLYHKTWPSPLSAPSVADYHYSRAVRRCSRNSSPNTPDTKQNSVFSASAPSGLYEKEMRVDIREEIRERDSEIVIKSAEAVARSPPAQPQPVPLSLG